MLRLLAIPAGLIVLLAAASIWSGGTTHTRADFTFVMRTDILTLDPNRMSYNQDMRIAYAIWEGLYAYDPMTIQPKPGVAATTDISPDKRLYIFHLRPEAKWNTGEPVTTADFVFEWRRMLETPGQSSYLYYYIHGAQKYLKDYQAYVTHQGAPADSSAGNPGATKPDFKTVGI